MIKKKSCFFFGQSLCASDSNLLYCTVLSLLLEQYSVAGAPMLKVKFVALILLSNVFYTVFSQCKGLHQIVLHAGS